MSFRTSEFLQRNELVRFQLDDVIRAPPPPPPPIINIRIKMDIHLQSMIDPVSTIGTMLISRSSSRYKNWLMVQPMVEIV